MTQVVFTCVTLARVDQEGTAMPRPSSALCAESLIGRLSRQTCPVSNTMLATFAHRFDSGRH